MPTHKHFDGGKRETGRGGRLVALTRGARLVILWERVWPVVVLIATIVGAFVAASWFGLWLDVPVVGRMVGTVAVALVLAVFVWRLLATRRPNRAEALARLDRDSGVAHRPATALADQLANPGQDQATRALWQLHRRRLKAAAAKLKVGAPSPRMVDRDRFALRAATLLAVIAAGFVAGPEKFARIAAAFDWRSATAAARGYRLDAWIDPPNYTGRPPVILPVGLDAADEGSPTRRSEKIQAPVGSKVVVRMSGDLDIAATVVGGLLVPPQPKVQDKVQTATANLGAPTGGSAAAATEKEQRWILKGNARLIFRRGDRVLAAFEIVGIADQPPTIAVTQVPVGNARGSLTISYKTGDDYGVTGAEAGFAHPVLHGQPLIGRSLVAPPRAILVLPPGPGGLGDGQTTTDLSEHPWAGAEVTMTLTARDDAGNVGESKPIQVTLPQRPFLKPLARALVEQRRDLVLDPDHRAHVVASLDALLFAPEQFTPEASIYLGLNSALTRLKSAKNDNDLRSVADLLWEMALRIEDGDLSDAERELRAAEQQLREAIQRGANDAEIKKLTDDLRAALDKFLSEMAQRAQRDPKTADKSGKPARTITEQQLKAMLDRMADAARNGNMADAQQMLDQLQSVLENLKTAHGKGDGDDPSAREMNQSLNELDQMTRKQQELRDKTFRQGQKRRDADRNKQGSQSGQSGQEGQQSPDEQADNGDQPSDQPGEERNKDGKGKGAQPQDKDLEGRQDALRKQLDEMKKRMKEAGIEGEKGLDDADRAMREAGKMLGEGRDGKAVDAQGRALEGLRRGAQGLAQRLENGDAAGQAEGEREGNGTANGPQRGRGRAGRDPLDRPTQNDRDAFRGGSLSGGPGAAQRAQQLLEELRRRLSDPQRSQEELDYLGRLLQRY